MKIKIFGKDNCGKCQSTKNKIKFLLAKLEMEDKVDVYFHNLDTVDGLAEGAFHDVSDALPTTIIEKSDEVIARWDGEVPLTENIKEHLEK